VDQASERSTAPPRDLDGFIDEAPMRARWAGEASVETHGDFAFGDCDVCSVVFVCGGAFTGLEKIPTQIGKVR
jgi:hypothetical protein